MKWKMSIKRGAPTRIRVGRATSAKRTKSQEDSCTEVPDNQENSLVEQGDQRDLQTTSNCGNCGLILDEKYFTTNKIFSTWNLPALNHSKSKSFTRKCTRINGKFAAGSRATEKLPEKTVRLCQMPVPLTLSRIFNPNPLQNLKNMKQDWNEDFDPISLCISCSDTLTLAYNSTQKFIHSTAQATPVYKWFAGENVGNFVEIKLKEEQEEEQQHSIQENGEISPFLDFGDMDFDLDLPSCSVVVVGAAESDELNGDEHMENGTSQENDENQQEVAIAEPLGAKENGENLREIEKSAPIWQDGGSGSDYQPETDSEPSDTDNEEDDDYKANHTPNKTKPSTSNNKKSPKKSKYPYHTNSEGRFLCIVCNQSFAHKKSYSRHYDKHFSTSTPTNQCPTCQKLFARADYLKLHRKIVHGEDIPGLNVEFTSWKEKREMGKARGKLKKINPARTNLCPICQVYFTSTQIQPHVESHGEQNPWKCEECQAPFPTLDKMRRHKYSKHSETRWRKCDQCAKSFRNKTALARHKIAIHQRQHPCPHCPKDFSKAERLTEHIQVVHELRFIVDCPVPLCNRKFKRLCDLHHHNHRVHQPTDKFKKHECPFCPGVEFSLVKEFKIHMFRAHGQRDFTCDQCGLGFTRVDNMKAHLLRKHNVVYEPCEETETKKRKNKD